VASRFLRRSGSEESIQWESRPSCASAPSLSFHPMPFRITQESYRPRVSHRTMVGALPTRSACQFQEPNGVDNGSCHETVGMGTTRSDAPPRKAVQTNRQSAGAGCARNSAASGGGRKMSLDIPFYRTPHLGSIWRNPSVCPAAKSSKRTEAIRQSIDAFKPCLRKYYAAVFHSSCQQASGT
jgi:hypothetical protein